MLTSIENREPELLGHSDFENRRGVLVHKEEMASIWNQSSVDVSTIKASHNVHWIS